MTIRFIVKCLKFHRDGNTDPVEVKSGEVLDITERQYIRLNQSNPDAFELIERRAPVVDKADIPLSTKSKPKRAPKKVDAKS